MHASPCVALPLSSLRSAASCSASARWHRRLLVLCCLSLHFDRLLLVLAALLTSLRWKISGYAAALLTSLESLRWKISGCASSALPGAGVELSSSLILGVAIYLQILP
jgi:hypothetical protein